MTSLWQIANSSTINLTTNKIFGILPTLFDLYTLDVTIYKVYCGICSQINIHI